MRFKAETAINATVEKVWGIITDIDNSPNCISGIEKVEILEKPSNGFIGLKWEETRTMFGQTATEIMWITEAVENDYYKVRAESHGAVYITEFHLTKVNGKSTLRMEFDGQPQTFSAKLMSAVTGIFFKKSTEKVILQDLEDIRSAAEMVK